MSRAQLRQAAVLLATLPQPEAALLLGLLDPREAELVAGATARLGPVDEQERDQVLRLFAAAGTRDRRPSTFEPSPLATLEQIDSLALSAALCDERAQTIALVLYHLPPRQASDVLRRFPIDLQAAVKGRMTAMGPVAGEIVDEVAAALADQLRRKSDRLAPPLRGEHRGLPRAETSTGKLAAATWPLPLAS